MSATAIDELHYTIILQMRSQSYAFAECAVFLFPFLALSSETLLWGKRRDQGMKKQVLHRLLPSYGQHSDGEL